MDNEKMRVAVYQRINSKSKRFDEVGQKLHYDYFFANHPNLTLVNIYSDTEDSRDIPAFRELLKECESGDIDVIIVHSWRCISVSFFDIVHTIQSLQKLPHPVGMFFENEHIYTLDAESKTHIEMECIFESLQYERKKREKAEAHRILSIRNAPQPNTEQISEGADV